VAHLLFLSADYTRMLAGRRLPPCDRTEMRGRCQAPAGQSLCLYLIQDRIRLYKDGISRFNCVCVLR
jgi:hypothetical protein